MKKMVTGPGQFSPYKPYARRASKFFHHTVTRRRTLKDGTQFLKLSCGHRILSIVPTSSKEMFCSQCVNDYLEANKRGVHEAN